MFVPIIIIYFLPKPLFWATITLFFGLRLIGALYPEWEPLEVHGANIIGTFLSLIMAFFVNQTRADFQAAYNNSMMAKGEFPPHMT